MQKVIKVVVIHENDSVAVAVDRLSPGDAFTVDGRPITVREEIPVPHKIALREIAEGETVYKYGYPIGTATQTIPEGALVHLHNLHSRLAQETTYTYHPEAASRLGPGTMESLGFQGYRRADGGVGLRNYIFIIPTVFCGNGPVMRLAAIADREWPRSERFDGFLPLTHPCGCGETGQNLQYTQAILSGLASNPNAAGVLFVGVGCEPNHLGALMPHLGDVDERRTKFMVMQEVEDEFEMGMQRLSELHAHLQRYRRETVPISELRIGVNCGGSDGFSGLTANPLVGAVTDTVTARGGTVVMTEVPEMFGAEQILMNRAQDETVFGAVVKMISDYKEYYRRYGIEVYKNPTPGNQEGGLTTLEEKSLGCTEKGGRSTVADVVDYGGRIRTPGFNLLKGPGHDLVGITAQIAAGCTLILFTTGRGTPGGYAAPVIRITTNTEIFRRKPHWADFDAGVLLGDVPRDTLARELVDLICKVAGGQVRTQTELHRYYEIGILRDGITT